MKNPLNSAARRAGLAAVAGLSALALAACGAGQVTQTSDQVAAVDGASAGTEDGLMAVRDVHVIVEDDATTGLKFTAINQDPSGTSHTLQSIKVDGNEVQLSANPSLGQDCSLVADTEQNIKELKKPSKGEACITYATSTVNNPGFPVGGNVGVTFTFDDGTIEMIATVSGNQQETFMNDRDVEN
ncbi:hypothetical protein CCICO_02100 [Corynebacterium ciconiae DSM 44920]|nr:hypothetical protein [Corynebacterium ciconiae]WKD60472.1 hypothetical protein CCICO_02100 [Corynebacterium ciconiae DSM 44920]